MYREIHKKNDVGCLHTQQHLFINIYACTITNTKQITYAYLTRNKVHGINLYMYMLNCTYTQYTHSCTHIRNRYWQKYIKRYINTHSYLTGHKVLYICINVVIHNIHTCIPTKILVDSKKIYKHFMHTWPGTKCMAFIVVPTGNKLSGVTLNSINFLLGFAPS